VEDTPWTLERLKRVGFPDEILRALDGVTKREAESYEEFVERSRSNPIAWRVKIADLEDNMDLRRLETLTNKDFARLRKYHRAWRRLNRP
jgi:hypothetical protein